MKGWFRTSSKPTEGGTNLRAVAMTAYEVASAMTYLHSQGVTHGVSGHVASIEDLNRARLGAAVTHLAATSILASAAALLWLLSQHLA